MKEGLIRRSNRCPCTQRRQLPAAGHKCRPEEVLSQRFIWLISPEADVALNS